MKMPKVLNRHAVTLELLIVVVLVAIVAILPGILAAKSVQPNFQLPPLVAATATPVPSPTAAPTATEIPSPTAIPTPQLGQYPWETTTLSTDGKLTPYNVYMIKIARLFLELKGDDGKVGSCIIYGKLYVDPSGPSFYNELAEVLPKSGCDKLSGLGFSIDQPEWLKTHVTIAETTHTLFMTVKQPEGSRGFLVTANEKLVSFKDGAKLFVLNGKKYYEHVEAEKYSKDVRNNGPDTFALFFADINSLLQDTKFVIARTDGTVLLFDLPATFGPYAWDEFPKIPTLTADRTAVVQTQLFKPAEMTEVRTQLLP